MNGELPLVMPAPTRPPLRYYGGKWRIAPWIISFIPQHDCWVEVFGGAGGVTLRKPRSKIEVWNDLDNQVFNFYRVLRNPEQLAQLVRGVDLTPFSRAEFELSFEQTNDPVEAARRFCVRTQFGHGTASIDPRDANGFRSGDFKAGKSYAREWAGIPEAIVVAANRMQGVTIENLDYRKLIPKFDHPKAVMYVDPPYPMSTRTAGGKGYVHELSDEQHRELHWMLSRLKAKVLVSGYECRLYGELYRDWYRAEKQTTASGQLGAVPRTEVLWRNYE